MRNNIRILQPTLYTLESSPDLLNWQPVLTNVGDGSNISTNFPATSDNRLFRRSLRPAH